MRGHRDLRMVTAAALVCALIAVVVPLEAVRFVVALPLALVFPGYAISAAVFADKPLQRPQVLLLSLGLSLATLALGALALNYVPGGINTVSWAVLVVGVVAGACTAAASRRPGRTEETLLIPGLRIGRRDGGLLLGGGALAAAAVALTLIPLPAKNAIGYTQLWMLPEAGSGDGVTIGVASQEKNRVKYRLKVKLDDGRSPVTSSLVLEPGERRVLEVPIGDLKPGTAVPVTARLFRPEQPTAYRRVTGWARAPEPTS